MRSAPDRGLAFRSLRQAGKFREPLHRRRNVARMNVSQIYDGDSEPVEMKIELEKEAAN
jgi:hypothetical protein